MAFKFYIDNQLTDQPVNDTSLVTTADRSNELNSLLVTQDVELFYNGNATPPTGTISGYAYLKGLFDDRICNEAEIEIYDEVSNTETVLIHKGIIKIPSISIDHQQFYLKTKIQDDSFYSYINNNRDIKVNLAAIETKSLTEIAPLDWYSVDLFNSYGCIYGSTLLPVAAFYKGYRVYDVLEFIIKVITDNKVSFQSTFLSTLTSELFLFKGRSLFSPYTVYPSAPEPILEISFQELFLELDKIYNLVFRIDNTDPNNPVFIIEDYESAYGSSLIYSFTDIKELNQSVSTANLYAQINTGSQVVEDGITVVYTWKAGRSYYGWKKESFHTLGQCNLSTQLNLVSEFIIDSNAIQDTVIMQSQEHLDDYFFIQCDNIDSVNLTAIATQFEFFGDGGCYYNLGINNFYKMQRHSVKFETSFGNFLGQGSDGFKALVGDDPSNDIIYQVNNAVLPNYVPPLPLSLYEDPAPFPNVTTNGGYDGNGNYDTVLFRYTVPVAGDYSFEMMLHYQTAGMQQAENFQVTPHIKQYDSLSVLITDQTSTAATTNNGTFYYPTTAVFNCQVGDIIEGSYQLWFYRNPVTPFPGPERYFAMLWDSYLECNGTPDSGINIASGNPDIKKYIYEFNYAISQSDFLNMLNNLTGLFSFEKDGVTRFGWIQNLSYNNWTGQSKIKLITNDAIVSE